MIKARACAGDPRAGARIPQGHRALHLAAQSRFRRDRGHPFDQAPDPRPCRPWRDRGRGPQHQARPRRHPRDRILRPDPAADSGRPQSATCASPRTLDALEALRARRPVIATRRRRDLDARLSLSAHARTSPADDRGRADPHRAAKRTRAWPISPASWAMTTPPRSAPALTRDAGDRAGPLCPAVRSATPTAGSAGQSGLHRRRGRSRNPRNPGAPWAFAMPAHVSGAIRGWHHGRIRAMRSAARARAADQADAGAARRRWPRTADPDAAFAQFDRFLSGLPSGVQLFSLFLARPQFLQSAGAASCGSAPRLADHLARNAGHARCAAGCRISCRRLPSRAAAGRALRRASCARRL